MHTRAHKHAHTETYIVFQFTSAKFQYGISIDLIYHGFEFSAKYTLDSLQPSYAAANSHITSINVKAISHAFSTQSLFHLEFLFQLYV